MALKIITHSERRRNLYENWRDNWPRRENSDIWHDVTQEQCEVFEGLVKTKVGERTIEKYLGKNKEILALTVQMFPTGNHMSWIFPKQQIRPSSSDPTGGLIPDYLLAGANSGGVQWFMLDLKGADKRAFAKTGKRVWLSADANKGVCQLLNYIDWSSRDQAYLRDSLGLTGFREPKGVLLIGTDDETEDDTQVRDFKGVWNNINDRLQIRSYSALLREVKKKLRGVDTEPWPPCLTQRPDFT
jgi:hypothetical protein